MTILSKVLRSYYKSTTTKPETTGKSLERASRGFQAENGV